MSPKHFLLGGGTILIIMGILGLTGLLGLISPVSFFHPPYWINWFHLIFGLIVLGTGLKGTPHVQAGLTLAGAIIGNTIGVLGLVFGPYLAAKYGIPELADPSDHFVHLIVGLFASFAWWRRK